MKVHHYTEISASEVSDKDASNVQMRILISKNDRAPNFIMRLFHVEPGGFTPFHSHNWEHEVFIVEGEGILVTKHNEITVKTGYAIFIEPNEQHQFKNTGNKRLSFICVVPVI